MSELKRLFDIAPENIHCTVRFGNVRDEIIAMSKEGEYDIIVIGSKNQPLQRICLVQMRNRYYATPEFRY
jgi:nucleotide-binding universal stress UspA family protein